MRPPKPTKAELQLRREVDGLKTTIVVLKRELEVQRSGQRRAFAQFERLEDAEQETVFRELKAAGHEFGWVRETRLRQLKREGWKPVFERDKIGRPTIFMDRKKERLLVHRPPPTA